MARAAKTSTRKPRAAVNPDETKAQKFSRLATVRVTKAVKMISLISNLSSSGYEYTQEQVDKIKSILTESVEHTMETFVPRSAKTETKIEI